MIRALAKELMVPNEYIAELDKLSAARFREQELAEVISSMPGIGPLLGAEFLAATAGVMADTAPPPALPRGLQRVSTLRDHQHPQLRRFYERKRAKVRRTQAVLALARRRVIVLWDLIRVGRCFQRELPATGAA
ncbi:hypothetical protein ACFVRD_34645 [Streptomyces sp. NPDC057908]|uniref:hypothetical protein n=1 Tax=Streptomyces sp. NPDC057908 TaxID=3346276 RepID=UPI0036F0A24A